MREAIEIVQRLAPKLTRRWFAPAALFVGLAVLVAVRAAQADEELGFYVVAHPDNATKTVSREFLADAFLKKVSKWPDGEAIRPVDLRFNDPARSTFSKQVLQRSVHAIRSYWQQRIFTGRGVPPPELPSDEAMLQYVQANPGALGYVSEAADTSTVSVIDWQ